MSYSPVCIVLGGFTPADVPVCSLVSCLRVVEDRRQLAVLLWSCLKYRPHRYRTHISLCVENAIPLFLYNIDTFS